MDDYDGQMIFGDIVGLKLPDICLTGEEKTQKNLTQETCPNRGSNPGPLRDKRACYHLFHSSGLYLLTSQPEGDENPVDGGSEILPPPGHPSPLLVMGFVAGDEELGKLSSIEPTAGPSGATGQFPMQSTGGKTFLTDDPSTHFSRLISRRWGFTLPRSSSCIGGR